MAKLYLKTEDENTLKTEAENTLKTEAENTPTIEETCAAKKDNEDDEAAFALLQKLETDEARLSEQKENLSSLLEQLQLKVRAEIENRKSRVRILKSEVTDLKTKCEKIAKFVNTRAMPE